MNSRQQAESLRHSRSTGQRALLRFQMLGKGWRLVGIFHANRLRWDCVGDQVRVLADWHYRGADDAHDLQLEEWAI